MLFCTAFCEIRVCLLYDLVYPLFISDSLRCGCELFCRVYTYLEKYTTIPRRTVRAVGDCS